MCVCVCECDCCRREAGGGGGGRRRSSGYSPKNKNPTRQCGEQYPTLIEGSLETKVPTIWTDEKHSQEEAEPGRNSDLEKVRREKIRDGESQKREDAGARKGRDSCETLRFFQFFVAPEGQKAGSRKRRVRSQLAR